MSNLSDFIGGVWRKLDIWRNANQNGLPMVQQAAFKYDPSYAIGTPVRLWSGSLWQALDAASGTAVYSSTDGKAWTLRTLPFTQLWRGIATDGTNFVAVGGTNTTQAAKSVNGTTWTASTMTAPADWGWVAYGAGKFVAMTNGTGSSTNYSSNAGTSWTIGALPSTDGFRIWFLNDRFITQNYYSTDGTTWGAHTGSSGALVSMAYGNSRYAGVNTGSTNLVYYSTNGTSFAKAILPVSDTWADIQFDTPTGLFVLVASSATGVVLTSPDCLVWTQRKNYDLTTGASSAIKGPTGLAVQQGGVLRMPDRNAVEVTCLI